MARKSATDNQHWTADPSRAAKHVQDLQRQATNRNNRAKLYLRLYWQLPYFSAAYDRDSRQYQLAAFEELIEGASFGLTREVIDAAASRLAQPVQARVEPVGSDARVSVACKKLGYLVDGIVEATDLHDIADRAYIDACTAGIGAVLWMVDNGKAIICERVDPMLTFWPEGTNEPDEIAVSMAYDKRRLQDENPKHADKIEDLAQWAPPTILGVDTAPGMKADTVRVDQIWSKRRGDKNGRYVRIAGGNGPNVLLSDGKSEGGNDEWEYERLPVNILRWQREFRGFGGMPLARIIAPYHVRTQRLWEQWSNILDACVPQLLEHEDTDSDDLTDQAFGRRKWSGAVEPKILGGNHVPPNIPDSIEALRMRAFAEGGVNPQSATGSKSAGVNSAVGQRQEQAIADVRFSQQQRARERFFTDCARSIIMLGETTYSDDNPAKIRAPGSKMLQAIPWSSIDLREDQYTVFMGVTSGLSLTFAGRLEEMVELRDAGAPISQAQFMKHMQLADTRSLTDRLTGGEDLAETQISAALDGIPHPENPKVLLPTLIPPSPMQDIETLITSATQAYQRAKADGNVPAENLEVLRRLIKLAEARRPMPAPPAPAAAGPVPPPAGAAPPIPAGGPAPMPM
jgi:hypothetical protein